MLGGLSKVKGAGHIRRAAVILATCTGCPSSIHHFTNPSALKRATSFRTTLHLCDVPVSGSFIVSAAGLQVKKNGTAEGHTTAGAKNVEPAVSQDGRPLR